VPTLKADLSDTQWRKWQSAKAEIGNGQVIPTKDVIEQLIDHYNSTKGRRIV